MQKVLKQLNVPSHTPGTLSILHLLSNNDYWLISTGADTFSKPVAGSDEPQQSGWFRTFTVAAYKPYFDVDTMDVVERIKDSLFPFRGTFNEKTSSNPDL